MRHGIDLCLAALFSATLFAQVNSASLTGLVTDPSGALVPSAKVTARSVSTNFERSVETDSSGYYFLATLPVGQYEVSVEHAGFQRAVRPVTLETAQKGRADFALAVGRIENTVTVEATTPQISTEDSSVGVGTVVDNTYVSRFPLFLRS